jgi:biopolymer transport protein ExbD
MLERSHIAFGPLESQVLRPQGAGSTKRSLLFTLTLTSLIDAFVIIVIYLLVNFGSPTSFNPTGKVELPTAVQNDQLSDGTVITLKDNHYFIGNQEVAFADIPQKLYALGQKSDYRLIIEADKTTDYDALSPVIQAGSQAGYKQFKFAVLQKGEVGAR